jgi:acyl-CoA thioester hydrolase
MNAPDTHISGQIIDGEHHLLVRIYYEDTDFSGIVYYANYLKFFERGRSDYMRLAGVHHHELAVLDDPIAFAVISVNVKYRTPARIDDLITVKTRVIEVRGASFLLDQWIERDGVTLVEGQIQVVCIDMNGHPKRMPAHVHKVIKAAQAGPRPA